MAINNGTALIYSDAGCTSGISQVMITNATQSQTFYVSSTTAPQSLTLVASSALDSDSQFINIGGTPTMLALESETPLAVDECHEVNISRLDVYGNKLANATDTLIDLSNDKSAQFYSDDSCTSLITQYNLVAAMTEGSFYIQNGVVENTVALTATDNGGVLTSSNINVDFVAVEPWWDTDWQRRVRVRITNYDQSVPHTNVPVLLKLSSANFSPLLLNSDASDIRVLDSTHTTQLNHEIESVNLNGTTNVWVSVPNIPADSYVDVWVYFDNDAATSSENANAIWAGHSGVWHLSDDDGAAAPQMADSTASSNHGTLENGAGSTPGVIGNGLQFDGDFDAMDVGFDLSTIIGQTSTLMLWMKTSQTGDNTMWRAPGITGVESAGNGNDIFFGWMDASGYIGVTAGNGAAAKSNFVVNDEAWRHVTITRDHVTGAVQFFVNGVLNGSGNSETGIKTSPFSKFGVVADTGGTPTEFDGSMDEIRLYNSIISADQIKSEFKYMTHDYVNYSSVETQ